MTISRIDHAAIPIQNVEAMLSFYKLLGFTIRSFNDDDLPVHAVMLGESRLNFHEPKAWKSASFPRGPNAVPGCGDFCFVWEGTIESAITFLDDAGINIELGPIERTGARDQSHKVGQSVYCRDPDLNLVEFIAYPAQEL